MNGGRDVAKCPFDNTALTYTGNTRADDADEMTCRMCQSVFWVGQDEEGNRTYEEASRGTVRLADYAALSGGSGGSGSSNRSEPVAEAPEPTTPKVDARVLYFYRDLKQPKAWYACLRSPEEAETERRTLTQQGMELTDIKVLPDSTLSFDETLDIIEPVLQCFRRYIREVPTARNAQDVPQPRVRRIE